MPFRSDLQALPTDQAARALRTARDTTRPIAARAAHLARAGRAWWRAHGLLTRSMAATHWAQCHTLATAESIVRRVLPIERVSVYADMAERLPALTPEFARAAVELGPEVVQAFLRRPDCTTAHAREMLERVAARPDTRRIARRGGQRSTQRNTQRNTQRVVHRALGTPWAVGDRATTFQVAGARGWSLQALVPTVWHSLVDQVLTAPGDGPTIDQAWDLILTVPGVSAETFDQLLRDGHLPRTDTAHRHLLRAARLTAAQRRALWQRLLATPVAEGAHSFPRDFDWSLPGAIEGLVDGNAAAPLGPGPGRESIASVVLTALRAATPVGRTRWWQAIAQATPSRITSLMNALWDMAPGDLLGWNDGVQALLQHAAPEERRAVQAAVALAQRPARAVAGKSPITPDGRPLEP